MHVFRDCDLPRRRRASEQCAQFVTWGRTAAHSERGNATISHRPRRTSEASERRERAGQHVRHSICRRVRRMPMTVPPRIPTAAATNGPTKITRPIPIPPMMEVRPGSSRSIATAAPTSTPAYTIVDRTNPSEDQTRTDTTYGRSQTPGRCRDVTTIATPSAATQRTNAGRMKK